MTDTRDSGPESGRTAPEDAAPEGAVVVGIDGQDHDATVVDWAVEEAAILGRPLHVQEVVDLGISLMAGEGYLPMTSLPADSVDGEHTALAAAAERARSRQPEVAVTVSSAPGSVAGVLVALSETASLLVVGGGGKPGRPFLGSTALSIVAHARCATVVVPDEPTAPTGKVVVGVDGSRASHAAAEYAMAYAERRGASVMCLVCWSVEVVDGCVVTTPGSAEWQQVEERHHAMVERVLADLRSRHPDVDVDIVVRRGAPAAQLIEHAQDAELIAVGSRGRGGFAGMLLGSTSKRVLSDSSCPVAVMRH